MPTYSAVVLAYTLAPAANTVELATVVPTARPCGLRFAADVLFATRIKVDVADALTVVLPTRIVVVLATTLEPTAIAVELATVVPTASPVGFKLAVDVLFATCNSVAV